MGIDINSIEYSLDNLYYKSTVSISDVIINRHGFSILPAGEPLAYAEQKLAGIPGREVVLSVLLAPFTNQYDYTISDCATNLALLTINALTVAADLIMTIKTEYITLE